MDDKPKALDTGIYAAMYGPLIVGLILGLIGFFVVLFSPTGYSQIEILFMVPMGILIGAYFFGFVPAFIAGCFVSLIYKDKPSPKRKLMMSGLASLSTAIFILFVFLLFEISCLFCVLCFFDFPLKLFILFRKLFSRYFCLCSLFIKNKRIKSSFIM